MRRCLFLGCFILLVSGFATGCNAPENDIERTSRAQSPQSLLENVKASLREVRPSVNAYRNAVQQLNIYMDQAMADQTFKLSEGELALLNQNLLRGVADRLKRISSLEGRSFDIVDAHYLDASFLFRDAARTLVADVGDQPPKNDVAAWHEYNLLLARHAFGWAMRHVQHTARLPGTDAWPAQEILRRGSGDTEERLRVFLCLMEQLNLFRAEERRLVELAQQMSTLTDETRLQALAKEEASLRDSINRFKLDACAVTRQVEIVDETGGKSIRSVPWAAGVLIGGELYLFDLRLGLPIPGQDGQGIATWKQLKQNPQWLQALYQGLDDPVLPGQLEKAEGLIHFNLPALEPRMLWLENVLEDNPVILHQDLIGRLKHLTDAQLGLPIVPWTKVGSPGYPILVLHQYVENPNQDMRLRDMIVPRRLLPNYMLELANQLSTPRDRARLFADFDDLFVYVRLEPGGVRDLLVRGRAEEAIQRIVRQEDRIDRMLDTEVSREFEYVPYLSGSRGNWPVRLTEASRKVKQLLQEVQQASDADRRALEGKLAEEVHRLEMMWKESQMPLRTMAIRWALPEYRGLLTYFMALAKMDLAYRAELQAERLKKQNQPWPEGTPKPEVLWYSAQSWLDRYDAMASTKSINVWKVGVDALRKECQKRLQPAATSLKK